MSDRPAVVVAGHICLDIIPRFLHGDGSLKPGALTEVGPAVTATGGAVANSGLALHRLGVPTALLSKLGDDPFAQRVLDILNGYSPSLTRSMERKAGETTSYTVVISPPGVDRYFLHCPGANNTFGLDDVPERALAGARLLHFGYPPLMRHLQVDGGTAMRGIFERAHGAGLVTSLDMAAIDPEAESGRVDWVAWLERVLPEVDFFVPSFDEVSFMLDGSVSELSADRLSDLGDRLVKLGAGAVLIKLGHHGLYLRTSGDASRFARAAEVLGVDAEAWAGRELSVPCFTVEVVGTTGAGDCTIAGFLSGLLRGETPEGALTSAVAVGSCSVESADAVSAVPAWSDVAKRLEAGWATDPLMDLPGWSVVGETTVVGSARDQRLS
ncbi:carbohydrate kinase family protein [Mucisphaera calidilacus]|uniref:Putative sugar kinase YdjH n=1 Tax=Mucisphaera calidilacus TaxID=2527982 RepID=A0A518BWS9_9BACT|nr:PfkB family carbohydrate kinase [Mucisphaera calidilacus]QDU71421.1 putative sugar kinase YdjH [Mucisphaera calidilacus]